MGETLQGVDYRSMPPKELASQATQVWDEFITEVPAHVRDMPIFTDQFKPVFWALIERTREYGGTG